MSRLDDELRNAFRREPPPAEFTERLLRRVSEQPAPKPRWWQRLATLVEPPKLRWIAIGVTASLLLAIGAAQYSKLNRVVVNDDGKIATVTPQQEEGATSDSPVVGTAGAEKARPGLADSATPSKPRHHGSASSITHRLALARLQKEREFRIEGEAAKERLMLALYIASSALNDAEKAIHNDGPTP
jgi:hypothetical protein